MPVRPSDVSQRPLRLGIADPRGDVLADVLSLGLLRNVMYRQLEAHAPWGLAMRAGSNRAMLYVITRGTARLEVEGERPRVLEAGHMVFLPHDVPHVLRDAPTTVPLTACDGARRATHSVRRVGGRGAPTSIVSAFFERSRRPPALLERPEVVVLSHLDDTVDPQVARTIELVLAEVAQPGPASLVLLQRLIDVLVVHALRWLARGGGCRAHAKRQGLVALSDPPIHEALTLLHTHVAHGWTVAELATRVGLSRSGFAARFTELVGEPPLQYLARWRIARAAELLRNGDEGIGEVAARVGYESVPSFSKAFKRWQGTSPGAYRREVSSGEAGQSSTGMA